MIFIRVIRLVENVNLNFTRVNKDSKSNGCYRIVRDNKF